MNSKQVLYISYDGMTDPLGQAQVIPYLLGLSGKGFSITILSFEKAGAFLNNQYQVRKVLQNNNITWFPLTYHAQPPLLATLYDVSNMWLKANRLHHKIKFDIVHCRSYISALIGLRFKKKYGVKFVFDMRGFWADERIDGNIWNLKNPVFKKVYKFFKRKEVDFLNNADCTISLTENAKSEIRSWPLIRNTAPISVIPCCVDTKLFNSDLFNSSNLKDELGITNTDFVLTYLGSIGTWYMLDEMLSFFKILKNHFKSSKFLFITGDDASFIKNKASEIGIMRNDIIVRSAAREDVPLYLQLSNLSVFFIKPSYSKKASSPTKMGELLSMNIPIICNSRVGDVDNIIRATNSGVIIDLFTGQEYEKAILKFKETKFIDLRKAALEHFSLDTGVKSYDEVYKSL